MTQYFRGAKVKKPPLDDRPLTLNDAALVAIHLAKSQGIKSSSEFAIFMATAWTVFEGIASEPARPTGEVNADTVRRDSPQSSAGKLACGYCNGTGKVWVLARGAASSVSAPCGDCHGTGSILDPGTVPGTQEMPRHG